MYFIKLFLERQTSDPCKWTCKEQRAIYFGFLESCYISWLVNFYLFWWKFSFDSTCIIVPLFSYTPNVPKILNRVDVHNYGDFTVLTECCLQIFDGLALIQGHYCSCLAPSLWLLLRQWEINAGQGLVIRGWGRWCQQQILLDIPQECDGLFQLNIFF